MSHLENELKEALLRQEPPEGFTERVLARAGAREPPKRAWEGWRSIFRMPAFRLAFAALGLVMITGVYFYQQKQERIRGERAKQDVVLALRVTATELDHAMQTMQGLNSSR